MSEVEDLTLPILLLGDTVGKSTFLSRFTLGPSASPSATLPTLRDSQQPFVFTIQPQRNAARSLSHANYRLEFFDTSYAEESYTLLKPCLTIMCFSVVSRDSLKSVQQRWKPLVETHFNYHEHFPVMLLGLQRDLRTEERSTEIGNTPEISGGARQAVPATEDDPRPFKSIMPQEGYRIAQEMRCDAYAECSAVTGELCKEVFQDIVRMAVGTAKGPGGGKTQQQSCVLM